jgi:hypothetical protein
MEEAVKYGNIMLLKASQQAGFLSAALIASITFWKGFAPSNFYNVLIFISLSISIFMSIFTHLLVGKTYIDQIEKFNKGTPFENAFNITPAWICGFIQILCLMIGLGTIFYITGYSQL